MSLIDFVASATGNYINTRPKTKRKSYGQFFTSPETAQFMAQLFDLDDVPSTVRILDPGAGSGMLATALIERLAHTPSVTAINLVCYENDPQVLPLLRLNLAWVKKHCPIELNYQIKADNYILSQAAAYNDEQVGTAEPKFDLVIGNPPYRKLAKAAPEARALPDVCYGAPNLYFLFAAAWPQSHIPRLNQPAFYRSSWPRYPVIPPISSTRVYPICRSMPTAQRLRAPE